MGEKNLKKNETRQVIGLFGWSHFIRLHLIAQSPRYLPDRLHSPNLLTSQTADHKQSSTTTNREFRFCDRKHSDSAFRRRHWFFSAAHSNVVHFPLRPASLYFNYFPINSFFVVPLATMNSIKIKSLAFLLRNLHADFAPVRRERKKGNANKQTEANQIKMPLNKFCISQTSKLVFFFEPSSFFLSHFFSSSSSFILNFFLFFRFFLFFFCLVHLFSVLVSMANAKISYLAHFIQSLRFRWPLLYVCFPNNNKYWQVQKTRTMFSHRVIFIRDYFVDFFSLVWFVRFTSRFVQCFGHQKHPPHTGNDHHSVSHCAKF